jgi:F0F1-type ATP synthase assembly protein I
MELVVKRLLLIQTALALAAAVGTFLLTDLGLPGALAALYGGATAVIGSAFGAWRLYAATRTNQLASAFELIRGLLLRFVLMAALLAAGLAWLKLSPGALVAGFLIGYLGYFLVRVPAPERPNKN